MTFGTLSSGTYIASYSLATQPLGPISSGIYIALAGTAAFGSVSSDQFQIGDTGAILLRGPQFDSTTIEQDRFSDRLLSVISVTNNIDLTSTGLTALYTVPSGMRAFISGAIVQITNGLNLTVIPTTSVETGSEIFASEPLTGLQNTGDIWSFWHDRSTTFSAAADETVNLNVTVAATATTLEAQVFLLGLLL